MFFLFNLFVRNLPSFLIWFNLAMTALPDQIKKLSDILRQNQDLKKKLGK